MDVDRFKQLPLLGILRGGDVEVIERLIETVVEAGLETLEIAMNTPDAAGMISRGVQVSAGRLAIGAGTVTTPARLAAALEAGATFVVMPTLVDEIMATCRTRSVPVFPGALTPQEIFRAWQAGATMVKVFPARFFGPDYFREVKGPFDDVELLACGGVNAENMDSYFDCGASAVAFGGSVFAESRLRARELDEIGTAVRRLVDVARARRLARPSAVL